MLMGEASPTNILESSLSKFLCFSYVLQRFFPRGFPLLFFPPSSQVAETFQTAVILNKGTKKSVQHIKENGCKHGGGHVHLDTHTPLEHNGQFPKAAAFFVYV